MKKLYLLGCIFAAMTLWSCGNSNNELRHSHEHGHNHAYEESEGEEHDHGDEIILHAHEAEKFGVKTMTAEPDTFYEVIEAAGQIVNSPTGEANIVAPKSGQIRILPAITAGSAIGRGQSIASVSATAISGGDADASSKARLDAAKRELDRLTPLLADGIVTRRDYEAARAEYELAKAAHSPAAAGGAVVSPISGVITSVLVKSGEYVNAGQPVATVVSGDELTLDVQVPSRHYGALGTIGDANIRLAGSDEWKSVAELGGKFKGVAPKTDNSGYVSVYFTVKSGSGVVPGAYVDVALKGTPRYGVMSVPVSAVTEQQGTKFVYVKVDEDGYEKTPVVTGATDGKSVEIISGLPVGAEIVCEGVTFVRLAETSGNVPEGHSHNH